MFGEGNPPDVQISRNDAIEKYLHYLTYLECISLQFVYIDAQKKVRCFKFFWEFQFTQFKRAYQM